MARKVVTKSWLRTSATVCARGARDEPIRIIARPAKMGRPAVA